MKWCCAPISCCLYKRMWASSRLFPNHHNAASRHFIGKTEKTIRDYSWDLCSFNPELALKTRTMRKLFSLFPFFSWLSMFSESWQIKPKPWIIWNLKIENWNLCQVWRWVVTNTNRTNQANHVLRKQRKQGYPNESETFAFLWFLWFLCEIIK